MEGRRLKTGVFPPASGARRNRLLGRGTSIPFTRPPPPFNLPNATYQSPPPNVT